MPLAPWTPTYVLPYLSLIQISSCSGRTGTKNSSEPCGYGAISGCSNVAAGHMTKQVPREHPLASSLSCVPHAPSHPLIYHPIGSPLKKMTSMWTCIMTIRLFLLKELIPGTSIINASALTPAFDSRGGRSQATKRIRNLALGTRTSYHGIPTVNTSVGSLIRKRFVSLPTLSSRD